MLGHHRLSRAVLILVVFGLFSACDDDDTSPTGDITPPARVNDLSAVAISLDWVTLEWSTPGDNGSLGTASEYDLRYGIEPITEDVWDDEDQAQGEPVPGSPGSVETFTVTDLQPGTTYHFALKTRDEVPNWSPLSNVETVLTVANEPPETFVTNSPVEPVGDDFQVHLYWHGTDSDGVVAGFVWVWNIAGDWNWTTRTDSVFVLSELGEHVFHVAAEDDRGVRDSTPATLQIDIPLLGQ